MFASGECPHDVGCASLRVETLELRAQRARTACPHSVPAQRARTTSHVCVWQNEAATQPNPAMTSQSAVPPSAPAVGTRRSGSAAATPSPQRPPPCRRHNLRLSQRVPKPTHDAGALVPGTLFCQPPNCAMAGPPPAASSTTVGALMPLSWRRTGRCPCRLIAPSTASPHSCWSPCAS